MGRLRGDTVLDRRAFVPDNKRVAKASGQRKGRGWGRAGRQREQPENQRTRGR